MLRRLSILVRKPTHDRAQFAAGWEHHGTLVKYLPGIRAYQQNHVVEEFGHAGAPPPFRIDGIVELRFDSMDAMREAFASDAAGPVKADEPNFLGHGTGYVAATPHLSRPAEAGTKLFVAARGSGVVDPGDALERAASRLVDLQNLIRDDVVSVIARPEMPEGPQPADVFLHLYFATEDAARRAGRALVAGDGIDAAFTVVRVRTLTVV